MPDYSAGTASVRITPDARSFLRDLEAKLRSMRDPNFTIKVETDTAQGRRETAQWRREEERQGLNVSVDADLADAVAEMTRWRQEQQRRGLEVPVDVDFEAAARAVESWRRDQESKTVDVPVDVETGGASANLARWRAVQEGDELNIKVKVDVSGAGAQLDGLNRRLETLSSSGIGRLSVGAFGLAAIQPAITALAEVAAGLQQVSQAGLALPGVFAGAAASVGTLVIGLSGIKDAYDAVSAASSSAGSDTAAQARASVSASNNLRNAVVDEARAREDVARATRQSAQELRDLRTEQRGGMIDESRAILEARKAREDLARGNYSDVRDATLRVAEADQRLIEVRNRNADTAARLNDANVKGVSGSDAVRDANERLIRSQQAVADAQLAAADAAGKSSSAQEKAAEAMGKLGPNARAVVDTLVALKPEFDRFRASISEPLLDGKAAEFEKFFTAVRPVAQRGLQGIAEGWNQNITAFLGSVSSERGQGILDRILGNTGDAQKKLSAAISPLVEGLGTLTAAGTDVLPRLADGFANVMDRFRDFIVSADEDGRLDAWINKGIDGVSMLGESILNVGKTFTGITKAIGGGDRFLNWLRDATGRLQTFINSAEGQSKLKEYFDQGREAIRQVVPLLQELPGMFKALGEGAAKYVGLLLPVLQTVADLIGEHPALVSTAVAAWLTWKTVSPIMSGLQGAINTFNTGVIGIGTSFADTRARATAETSRIDKAFKDAGKDGSGLNKFSRGVGALGVFGGPFGILAGAIAAFIPTLVDLGDKMSTAADKTDYLNKRQLALEETLDRVTGKLTRQTLRDQIEAAQRFDPPENGVPGINSGDALAAATSLGIAPDVYGRALIGDPAATQAVRDVLVKNNLNPEFDVSKDLQARVTQIGAESGGRLGQADVVAALSGDKGAFNRYDEFAKKLNADAMKLSGAERDRRLKELERLDLQNIAMSLSKTGKASILAGGALTTLTSALPHGGPTVQANQAEYGRFRIKAGSGSPIPDGTVVNSSGQDYQVSVSKDLVPQLISAGLKYEEDIGGATVTATIPLDSPWIEKYKTGGPTKGPRGQGFLAELHGQEWVHDAGTVDTYGRDVMNALWRKQIDPKAVKALVPGFSWGGPTDPNDPNYVGMATGQTAGGTAPGPAPIAPNVFGAAQPGVIDGVTDQAVDGTQGGVLSNLGGNILSQFGINVPGLQQNSSSGESGKTGMTPGLWGLAEVGGDPDKQRMWEKQTLDWLVNDWVGGTIVGGLMGDVLPKAMNAVELGGILQSPILQGVTQAANYFMKPNTPQQDLSSGYVTLPDGTQLPLEQLPTSAADGTGTPSMATLQQLLGGGGGGVGAAVATQPPAGPGNQGLQINTLRGKSIIQSQFPWATNIGGVRSDRLKWHPSGLALDVMIPGAGGNNDPATPDVKAKGDQLYAWLMARKDELGIDYIMWQVKDHLNHLHVNFAPSGYPDGTQAPPSTVPAAATPPATTLFGQTVPTGPKPAATTRMDAFTGFKTGGHTPGSKDTPVPALLHGDEFVQRNAAVEKYGLPFMNAVNDLRLDPALIPQMAVGGSVRDAIRTALVQPTPRPPEPRRYQGRPRPVPPPPPVATPPVPSRPPVAVAPPAAAPTPAPAVPPPAPPVAMQPPPQAPPTFTPEPGAGVAPPGPIDNTLPWINTAIESTASTIGSAVQTAAAIGTMGATGGLGGALAGGSMGGLSIQGGFQQIGKVAQGVANVISSALVGSVPGSFMTTPEAYGRTLRPEQNTPRTAMPPYGQGRTANYYVEGVDTRNMLQELQLRENMDAQAALANYPGRI